HAPGQAEELAGLAEVPNTLPLLHQPPPPLLDQPAPPLFNQSTSPEYLPYPEGRPSFPFNRTRVFLQWSKVAAQAAGLTHKERQHLKKKIEVDMEVGSGGLHLSSTGWSRTSAGYGRGLDGEDLPQAGVHLIPYQWEAWALITQDGYQVTVCSRQMQPNLREVLDRFIAWALEPAQRQKLAGPPNS
ncbi:hypothetical protein JCM1840_003860, partial [Sporobolomyces johnsonii]